MKDSNFTW